MEHNLYNWIASQNANHGVAPSREQVVEQLETSIPLQTPQKVRVKLCNLLNGHPRKQRKWLARFRKRWGARIGVLRPQEAVSLPDRRQKAGGNL